MKPLGKRATATLDKLTAGLEPGTSRKVANSTAFMPLSVERLDEDRFSIAHYFEQNGDLVPDPDMSFWKDEHGRYFPIDITMATGKYTRAISQLNRLNDGRHMAEGYYRGANRELVSFAHMWLKNIKSQQLDGHEPPASDPESTPPPEPEAAPVEDTYNTSGLPDIFQDGAI